MAPILYEEAEDEDLKEYSVEAVYEYGGENLLTALKNATGLEVMKVMGAVARIMAKLEIEHIFHSDLKPANIVIANGVVKLLDFGVAMTLNQETRMLSTKNLKGGTFRYLPPEVLTSTQGKPTAVDV